jgi:hypothetical protein
MRVMELDTSSILFEDPALEACVPWSSLSDPLTLDS